RDIRRISLSEVQQFRYQVLQPEEKEHSVYELDDASNTLHIGAFSNDELVAVATICAEPMPVNPDDGQWRLRGMATLDRFRGKGLGRRLTEACMAHARSEGGVLVRCSARCSAMGFYGSLGFVEDAGDPFILPEYSSEPYYLMRVRI